MNPNEEELRKLIADKADITGVVTLTHEILKDLLSIIDAVRLENHSLMELGKMDHEKMRKMADIIASFSRDRSEYIQHKNCGFKLPEERGVDVLITSPEGQFMHFTLSPYEEEISWCQASDSRFGMPVGSVKISRV